MKSIFITIVSITAMIWIRYIWFHNHLNSLQGKAEKIVLLKSTPKQIAGMQLFSVDNVNYKASPEPILEIGDLIIVVGNYSEQVINPIYIEKYMIIQDIKILQKYHELSVYKRTINYPFLELEYRLSRLRSWAINIYNQSLSLESSSLLAGMVLGAKESISPKLYNQMKASGLAHLVVASGSNIALVAAVVLVFFKFLPLKSKYLMSGIIVWSYAVLAGMDPPIIRAAIMINLIWMAKMMGRKTSGFWVLIITSLIMILISPYILFSLSFQLSVAATAGIVLYSQTFNQISNLISKKCNILGWIMGLATQTVAAQILIYPLLFHYFANTNILSILANMAVTAIVTPVVLGGIALLPMTFIIPTGVVILTMPLELTLRYINSIGSITSNLSFAVIELNMSWWGVVFWWTVVLVGMSWIKNIISTKITSIET